MSEERYAVTIHPTDDRPSARLLVPRTAAEVEALRAKGHRLTTEPPMPNRRRTTFFSDALAAVARLRVHAESVGDQQLKDRASRAVIELLRGSGLSIDDDRDGAPSSRQLMAPPMRKPEHTLPGIGGRRVDLTHERCRHCDGIGATRKADR